MEQMASLFKVEEQPKKETGINYEPEDGGYIFIRNFGFNFHLTTWGYR
jgi:hypothetical protein